jgi:hypothetical protein
MYKTAFARGGRDLLTVGPHWCAIGDLVGDMEETANEDKQVSFVCVVCVVSAVCGVCRLVCGVW